jgi:hypothetical protein
VLVCGVVRFDEEKTQKFSLQKALRPIAALMKNGWFTPLFHSLPVGLHG